MNTLEEIDDVQRHAQNTLDVVKQAIAKLHEAQKLNAGMQKAWAGCTSEWHIHETIDDRIHEALSLLGD